MSAAANGPPPLSPPQQRVPVIERTSPQPSSQSQQLAGRSSRKSTASSAASGQSRSSVSLNDRRSDVFQYRAVRTLPIWVQEYDEDETPTSTITVPPPLAHKNNRPPGKSVHDHRRENDPVTMGPTVTTGSRWRMFVDEQHRPGTRSQGPLSAHDEKTIMNGNQNWLEEGANLDEPWLAGQRKENEEGEKDRELLFLLARRRIWYKRIQKTLLNNPMVPLTLRASIWLLSLFALAFACSVFHLSNKYDFDQKPSTTMAIVVDVVAMVYLIYITYDEYSGKPLGLRSPKAKMRLIMFDLFFIIFDSANTALAFDSLFDASWSCISAADEDGRVNAPICRRQRALASFLFLALCAWVSTFTISVFRLVERVSRNV